MEELVNTVGTFGNVFAGKRVLVTGHTGFTECGAAFRTVSTGSDSPVRTVP